MCQPYLPRGGQRGDAGGQELVVGLLQLGVAGRRGADAGLLERGLAVPAPDAERDERDAGLDAVEGHPGHGGLVDLGVPAELRVVGAEVEGLLGLRVRGTDLTAPDPPDVGAAAAQQLGPQLVGVDRRARARQAVDGGDRPGLGVEGLDLGLQQVDGLVALVGEDAQLVGGRGRGRGARARRARCGSGAGTEAEARAGGRGEADESSAGE